MPNWSEKIFVISKIKKTVPLTYVLNDLKGEEIIGTFYENELQSTKQNEFRIEKVIKKKVDKLYVKGRVMIIRSIVGLIKKTLYKMSQYFPKPYEPFGGDINVKVDLSNYATKAHVKNITHVDTSSFVLKTNLANLKTEVDKLDIDKLATVPVDLSKLSNVVKNDVVKKTVYDKLVAKVNNIDTSDFVLKTNFNTKLTGLENKIPNTSGLVKKTDYNTKITEDKIHDISGLATKTALTTAEIRIPKISGLVKKIDYNTKITDIENKLNNHNHVKYVATSVYNTLAANVFNARLAEANLITRLISMLTCQVLIEKLLQIKQSIFLMIMICVIIVLNNILMKEAVNKIIWYFYQ